MSSFHPTPTPTMPLGDFFLRAYVVVCIPDAFSCGAAVIKLGVLFKIINMSYIFRFKWDLNQQHIIKVIISCVSEANISFVSMIDGSGLMICTQT